jgi:hypothetical protein
VCSALTTPHGAPGLLIRRAALTDMTGGGLGMTRMTVLLAGGIFLLAVSAPALDLQVMQTAVRVQERILDTIVDADTSFRVDTTSINVCTSGNFCTYLFQIGLFI